MPPPAAKILFPHCCLLLLVLLAGRPARSQLNARFTADQAGGCSPLIVSFTDHSTGTSAGTRYSWDFGNGNSSTLANPKAIFTDRQTYTVTLTLKDGSAVSQFSQEITVYKDPVADFSASAIKGCLPLDIGFTASAEAGDGQVSGYTWDFGDGSTGQGQTNTQSHTYGVAQTITASLTVTNNHGCHTSIRKPDLIKVIPSLTAGFSTDKKVLCQASDPVQFNNTSQGPGTLSYRWDFGDGNSSAEQNPRYAFNKKGIYSVKLTVSSSEGCSSSMQQTDALNVASYKTDFDAPASVCQFYSASFNNQSSPTADESVWVVDGVQIYSYNALAYPFSSTGAHTVQLNNRFGTCQQSASKEILVNPTPIVGSFDAIPSPQCDLVSYQFRDHTPDAVSWEWDFNYFSDPPHIGSNVQAPVYSYPGTADGPHLVWLRVTNAAGCSAGSIRTIDIQGPEVSILMSGNSSSCADPLTENFSVSSNRVLASYLWHFGDGQTSTDARPTHTFSGAGHYLVSLDYTTAEGCQNSVRAGSLVVIAAKPDVDFKASATNVCGNTQIQFVATPNDPDISYWSWNFGDGEGYGSAIPDYYHTYKTPGTYTVTLHMTGICNADIIKTDYITVQDFFAKMTSADHTCDGSRGEVAFTQESGHATSLVWDFGDGTTLTSDPGTPTVKHEYKKTGSYNAVLTASNGQCSLSAETTVAILLKQRPVLSAGAATACRSDEVPIQVAGLETNPEPFGYSFPYNIVALEYPDGSLFDGNRNDPYSGWQNNYQGTVNSFIRPDQHFRAIVMSSYFNCADTSNFITLSIKGAVPGFSVLADNGCYQSPVVFRDTSKTTGNNPILSWQWDFGDGTTAAGTTNSLASHIYADPGSYLVTLRITDAAGCSSATPPYNQRVTVQGPRAAFTASEILAALNSTIYFNNNSNAFGSPDIRYTWDFGDQTAVSADFNGVHTYPLAGTYTVSLKAENLNLDCFSTASQQIVVKNFNTAFGFRISPVSGACPPVLVSFNNSSVNYSRISWDFGDGITADNLSNPTHVYTRPGRYIVTLYGYAPNGLMEQRMDSLFIELPTASVSAEPAVVCIGGPFLLSAKASATQAFIWDFGDGHVLYTDTASCPYAYPSAGTYYPKLMIRDSAGCYGHADPGTAVSVRDNPVIVFSPENPLICRGSPLTIQASGGSHYTWSPATGLSDPGISDPSVSPIATTSYELQVSDDFGCKNSRSLTVAVVQPGMIRVNPDTAICAGEPVPLKASGEALYHWIGNTAGLDNTEIPAPVALPPETLVYTVTGSDDQHCFSDTAAIHIRVKPLPEVDAGQDPEIWSGETAELSGTGSTDIQQWTWTPAQYLDCADCPAPRCTPLSSTWYTLTARNQDGCLASDSVFVKLDCGSAHVSVPNIFTPNHDGLNDVFMIRGIATVKHLLIYNRWGEKVFERRDFLAGDRSACWDGSFKGQEAPVGSYVYFIEMVCPDGGAFSRKGSVVLVR